MLPLRRPHPARTAAWLSGLGLLACGCGGGTPPTVTVTATPRTSSAVSSAMGSSSTQATITDTPTDTGTVTASGTAGARTTGTGGDVPPSGPPVIGGGTPLTVPRRLTLADVFSAPDWREGSITVPKESAPLQGIYTTVNGCSSPSRMELRFADQRGQLHVTGAQALNSPSSAVVLEYRLLADGRLVDTKTVRFNERQLVKADLTGVSSVIIEIKRVQINGTPCGTTAVLTDLSIDPRS